MPSPAKPTTATIIPSLRYRDAPAMIEWLCNVFGFEKHVVYTDDSGKQVMHAQLTFGNGMIMLGSAEADTEWGRQIVQPDKIGGRQTQTCYMVVADIAAHYAHTQAAGAEIVRELAAEDYGGSDYTCRDPAGHLWTVGDYDPWADHAA